LQYQKYDIEKLIYHELDHKVPFCILFEQLISRGPDYIEQVDFFFAL
jgi:hypothetical protein